MMINVLGDDHRGDVISACFVGSGWNLLTVPNISSDNHSKKRSSWSLKEWRQYMSSGHVSQDRMPGPPMTAQHEIYNMASLEVSTTAFAKSFGTPHLQKSLDSATRFGGSDFQE